MSPQTPINVVKDSDFPIQNLPYSIFTTKKKQTPSVCTRFDNTVIDLAALVRHGFLDDESIFAQSSLNAFMATGKANWQKVRTRLTELLQNEIKVLEEKQDICYHIEDVTLHLPIEIGDYTDFYSSIHHARNIGTMFRPNDNPLLPNYVHVPVGYHGRASSVVVSDTEIKRPHGQILPPNAKAPIFSPSKKLDFELEMAFVVGTGNQLGEPINIDNAYDHIFGLTLMNDWSARDIQKWEYVPLGPFLSKSFATTISPWIIPLLALEPFKTQPEKQDPKPLDYLQAKNDTSFDINLTASIQTKKISQPEIICQTNFSYLYWTMAQQLAHHTVNGCNIKTGDLMASGTISGSEPGSYGSLLELAWGGQNPLTLSSGETRTFLEDGDTITLNGFCQGGGYRIGFGEAKGKIMP